MIALLVVATLTLILTPVNAQVHLVVYCLWWLKQVMAETSDGG